MDDSPALHGANAAHFDTAHDDVFGRIASRYDLLCDLFSLGIHRIWKRRVAAVIAGEPWTSLLDVASGTGDIVRRLIARLPPEDGRQIIASDISPRMLAIAQRRLAPLPAGLTLQTLDAHAMPEIAASSMDVVAMSLGLKICDRQRALAEIKRVLKPGGRLVVLEASNIPLGWLHRAYLGYMAVCMPLIGWLATGGDTSAYRYLLAGIRDFPTAEGLASEIEAAGFKDVRFERLSLGIVAIHCARKPIAIVESAS